MPVVSLEKRLDVQNLCVLDKRVLGGEFQPNQKVFFPKMDQDM
jgi:hypothetical protein